MKLADVLNMLLRRPDDRTLKAARLKELTTKVEDAKDEVRAARDAIRQRNRDEQVIFAARDVVSGLRRGER